jgi:hypothetical protein
LATISPLPPRRCHQIKEVVVAFGAVLLVAVVGTSGNIAE